nr:hypothetical protein BaRGS_019747 [Batillaria attramentaria]
MSAEPRIENLDEFDEAEELCQYLQGNPEDYFRIIRKRKQEEMESAGIFSYLKVKMMGLLHGERYPACLVSPQQSTEKLEQLKADMQKAFTYSEESKGRRCSKRIASRTAQLATLEDKENTPLASTQSTVRRTRLATADKTDTPTMQASCSRAGSARGLRSTASITQQEARSSLPPVATVIPNQNAVFMTASQENAPVAPPPPPPPPLLPQHQLKLRLAPASSSSHGTNSGRRNLRKRSVSHNGAAHPSNQHLLSPSSPVPPRRQKVSPTHQLTDGCGERVQHGSSGSRATSPASLCSSPSDTEFVTPEADVPVKNKKHKRTLSSTSTGSLTSMSSLTSVHSELMSSNPITRLRSTQIARSVAALLLGTLD